MNIPPIADSPFNRITVENNVGHFSNSVPASTSYHRPPSSIKKLTQRKKPLSDIPIKGHLRKMSVDQAKNPLNIHEKRIVYIKKLREIHSILRKIIFNIDPKVSYSDKKITVVTIAKNEGLHIVCTKDLKIDPLAKVVDYIYEKLFQAIGAQIFHFFDDRGFSVNLKEIDILAVKMYSDFTNIFKERVQKALEDCYEIRDPYLWGKDITEYEFTQSLHDLPTPSTHETQGVSDKKKLCFILFQRMYPQDASKIDFNKPIISPQTLLCKYRDLFTTDEVFEQILENFGLPDVEMPVLQKLRNLNFLRVWLESHLYPEEKITKKRRKIIDDILNIGFKSEAFEMVDLCYEINLLLDKSRSFSQEGFVSPKVIRYELEKIFQSELHKEYDYEELVDHVTADIKYLASQNYLTLTQNDLFSEKATNESLNFYNQIIDFGKTRFIQMFEFVLSDGKIIDVKFLKAQLIHFFKIFIDITAELIEKNDFLSSMAFNNVLNTAELYQLIVSKKQTTISKKEKFVINISPKQREKLKNLNILFNPSKNFSELRAKMEECYYSRIAYVPQVVTTKQVILHSLEKIDKDQKYMHVKGRINYVKMQAISQLIWDANCSLNSVRENFKDQKFIMNSDIGYQIITVNSKPDEDKLYMIYQKIRSLIC
jgi:hypothetical protein